MDELKNKTQEPQEALGAQEALEAREDYPFIVAITAALLSSSCSLDTSQERIHDPEIMDKLPQLIQEAVNSADRENPPRGETMKGFDPRLDPTGKEYDADAYHAAVADLGADTFHADVLALYTEWTKSFQRIRESFLKVQEELGQTESWQFLPQGFYLEISADDKPQLPRIIARPVHALDYPLDKPNSKIWNLLTTAEKNGQLKLDINTGKRGSDQNAVVVYAINFDDLPDNVTISKNLTQYDKRCYIAVAALYNGGNEVVSVSQIYRQMGNTGSPAPHQIKKINDSLTKMGIARIYVDNAKEAAAQKKRTHYKYDGSLLPFERVGAYINNSFCEAAVHIFREPPLISFARERKQITTIPRKVLESPISKTEANLQIEDYLLERISHMKAKKAEPKLLYTTIYENCNVKEKKQRQRVKDKILTYLKHYKKTGFIKGYEVKEDAIEFKI